MKRRETIDTDKKLAFQTNALKLINNRDIILSITSISEATLSEVLCQILVLCINSEYSEASWLILIFEYHVV